MIGNPVCVAATGDVCGEGAVWHSAHHAVYWTDINRFLIHRLNLGDSSVRTWLFDEPVTALSLTDREDVLAVVLGSQVILWEPALDIRRDPIFRLDEWPKVRLNDARCDPRGSLWIGSMRNNVNTDGSSSEVGGNDGILIRVDPDAKVTSWRQGVAISNERPFLEGFARGFPDGSAVDSEGYLWNCRFYGSCIVRVAPDGTIDRVVDMPVQNITTCTFGGSGLTTLFVTTASADSPRGDRLAGSLFSIQTNILGQPENRFCFFGRGQ